MYNYWAPLTASVEDVGRVCSCQNEEENSNKNVRFVEPIDYIPKSNRITEKWKQKLENRHARKIEQDRLKQEIMNGSIPLAVVDLGDLHLVEL